ncbi:MAG: bifunctional DNA-binding transcriptional regulator/O6-methylguanine-DNA methyltransferase Ada [Pseudomonadota bacterium]
MTLDPDTAWEAILSRDAAFDGVFLYAVKTTGIFCRPSCPARKPLRRNVRFFQLNAEAEAAGYRACKRCKPKAISTQQRQALAVEAACRTLEAAPASLSTLAGAAGLHANHFHRVFAAHTGVSPKAYGDAVALKRVAKTLGEAETVTDAAFAAGFETLAQFYDRVAGRFGLRPNAMVRGGHGEVIITRQTTTPLGVLTVAFSRNGIAAIVLSDAAAEGLGDVTARFRHALVVDGGADFSAFLDHVVAAVAEPAQAEALPLDVRGTAFEARVWRALRDIPVGTTASYGEIAAAIGAPKAHRAVARACAANAHAVAIPCHRVVRADGSLSGYRWGVPRKAALLATEAVPAMKSEAAPAMKSEAAPAMKSEAGAGDDR